MKKYFLVILLVFSLVITAEAKDIRIEGDFEDIISNMNLVAKEFLSYAGFSTHSQIDAKACEFEIISAETGSYACNINASTDMMIFTDKYLRPYGIKIFGVMEDNMPRRTTYDWAFDALMAMSYDLYFDDIKDIFLKVMETGYYEAESAEIVAGPDPNYKNLWVFIIHNI